MKTRIFTFFIGILIIVVTGCIYSCMEDKNTHKQSDTHQQINKGSIPPVSNTKAKKPSINSNSKGDYSGDIINMASTRWI